MEKTERQSRFLTVAAGRIMSGPAALQVDALEREVTRLESELRLAEFHMRRYRAMLPDNICYDSCGVCGHAWFEDGRGAPRRCRCGYIRICSDCASGDYTCDGCPPAGDVGVVGAVGDGGGDGVEGTGGVVGGEGGEGGEDIKIVEEIRAKEAVAAEAADGGARAEQSRYLV